MTMEEQMLCMTFIIELQELVAKKDPDEVAEECYNNDSVECNRAWANAYEQCENHLEYNWTAVCDDL